MPKILWDLVIETNHPFPTRRDLVLINKKKSHLVHFAVSTDHSVKIEEIEKRDTYLVLARELKMLRNMKVTVKLIVGALKTVLFFLKEKNWDKRI